MTKAKEIELIQKMDTELLAIIGSKGADYGTEDMLSNFKRVSAAAKALNISVHTPEGYALFMVVMKIDRINNLIEKGKTPSNESVNDSFGDGINYFKLGWLCHLESKKYEEKTI